MWREALYIAKLIPSHFTVKLLVYNNSYRCQTSVTIIINYKSFLLPMSDIGIILLIMRKEPYTVGSIVHVVKRGARGLPIVRNESDKWRFLTLLYFLNDKNRPIDNWKQDIRNVKTGFHTIRPLTWTKPRLPMVNILSYCLMPNHFHLLLEEIEDGGISKFMQGLCVSMSSYSNLKYKEKGSLFQGAFKSKTIDSDYYLDLVSVYINVKNPFELYEKGLENAIENFDDAYAKAMEYNFCSLGDIGGDRSSLIISRHELLNYTPIKFKSLSRGFLLDKLKQIQEVAFE